MDGIGPRLRKERERLGMTQRAFGEIGGVEPNAQGKYESGERTPRLDYLAALAAQGVDALYVLNGTRTPAALEGLSMDEAGLLAAFRQLSGEDQAALWHLMGRLTHHARPRQTVRPFSAEAQSFLTEGMR
ncbi:helix-turn-helix domain-containing protein [Pseudomonas sp. BCRC 81390]|uniref:helix-turn-helix domain-containing protein n=1 Tax=Pseudomonas sp. BCRC 81390 TaxID=3054778 RepID=UPI0025937F04|nr:helix-turn-helix domain-containing protein [Pseudomonas sp. BCRC 81390]MDM3887149.1 helix-turn-helix domain-containing protein [Pseudomonas sp. BCRC 81390]